MTCEPRSCDITGARSQIVKALEFDGRVAESGEIRVPPDGVDQIPEGSVLRVILLVDTDEDDSWRQL
jgi:hypothetical protein